MDAKRAQIVLQFLHSNFSRSLIHKLRRGSILQPISFIIRERFQTKNENFTYVTRYLIDTIPASR